MVLRFSGDEKHEKVISSGTVNINAEILNLVIFSNLVNFL